MYTDSRMFIILQERTRVRLYGIQPRLFMFLIRYVLGSVYGYTRMDNLWAFRQA